MNAGNLTLPRAGPGPAAAARHAAALSIDKPPSELERC